MCGFRSLSQTFAMTQGKMPYRPPALNKYLNDRDPRPSMKTSVLKKPARSTHQTRTQRTEDYWIDAALEPATSTQDSWLIAHSQNLRAADGDGIDARFDGVAAKAGLCPAAV